MAIFYPRRQTAVIFLVCSIAVGGVAWYARSTSGPAQNSPAKVDVAAAVAAPANAPIVTNDDWKKQFYDTSSNGSFKASPSPSASAAPENLTATDRLGRQFLIKYGQMYQAGLTTDQDTVTNVTTQLVNDSMASMPTPKAYTQANIHVIAATDQASLKAYAATVNQVLASAIPDQDHNEAVIAENALDQNDMSILKGIDPIIAGYGKAVRTLAAMNVPKPLSQSHLNLLNGFSIALYNAQALRNLDKDPVKGMAAIALEVTSLQAMRDAVASLNQYFLSAGISSGFSS